MNDVLKKEPAGFVDPTMSPQDHERGVVGRAGEAIKTGAQTAGHYAKDAGVYVKDHSVVAARATRDATVASATYVKEHPIPFVLIGAGVGLLGAMLIRNRVRANHPTDTMHMDDHDTVGHRTMDRAREVAGQVRERSTEYYGKARTTASSTLETHPLAVCAGAALIGAAIGYAIPSSPPERRALGPARDRLLEAAKSKAGDLKKAGSQALDEGLEAAKDSLSSSSSSGPSNGVRSY
jgi:ElaB/YqjD/DUF883 family membrane-anchored ribosome-binding protein